MRTVLFFPIFILSLTGCKPVDEKADFINDAEQLLNQGNYEEVIGLLSEDADRNDANSEIRILLASAYAGSIGLNLVDSYPAFEELLFKVAIAGRTSATEISPIQDSSREVLDQQKAEQELLNMVEVDIVSWTGHFPKS